MIVGGKKTEIIIEEIESELWERKTVGNSGRK